MKTLRTTIVALAAGVAFITPLNVAQQASAHETAGSVQKVADSDDLFLVNGTSVKYLTFDAWRSTGFMQPKMVPAIPGTTYLQQKGFDSVFANVGGRTHHVSFSGWLLAGAPKPQSADYETVKFDGLDPLYARTKVGNDPNQWLWQYIDYPHWSGAGFASPITTNWIKDALYCWVNRAPHEIHIKLDTESRRLTFSEWVSVGRPQPTCTLVVFPSIA